MKYHASKSKLVVACVLEECFHYIQHNKTGQLNYLLFLLLLGHCRWIWTKLNVWALFPLAIKELLDLYGTGWCSNGGNAECYEELVSSYLNNLKLRTVFHYQSVKE